MEGVKIGLIAFIILLIIWGAYFVIKCYLQAQKILKEKPIRLYYKKLKTLKSYCKLDDVSPNIIMIVVALEDPLFFRHNGYVLKNIFNALMINIKSGYIVRGGSTITQQLAKNMYFPFVKTYERKLTELFVAFKLEETLSKNEILDIYLNVIFYGMKQYGIKNACEFYFDKQPSDISLNEALTIGCILPTPLKYNPLSSYKMFYKARENALRVLCQQEFLKEDEISLFLEAEYNEVLVNDKINLIENRFKVWFYSKKNNMK